MIVTTTFNIEGYKIDEYKGIVRGLIVRSPTIVQGIFGGLKSLVGGKINSYAEMCETTRVEAYDMLINHAMKIGANAVVGFSYDTSELGKQISATEILCYGTAVIISKL